jgi:hypothetical protein
MMVSKISCGVPIPEKTTEPPSSIFGLGYVGRLVKEQKRLSDVATALCAATRGIPNLYHRVIRNLANT